MTEGKIPREFVFYEPSGRRWRWFVRGAQGAAFLVIVALAAAIVGIAVSPKLPTLMLPSVPHLSNLGQARSISRIGETNLGGQHRDEGPAKSASDVTSPLAHPSAELARPPLIFGYYVNWDAASIFSLRLNIDTLTHLVPEWFTLQNAHGDLEDTSDPVVIRLAERANVAIVAMVTNFRDGAWRSQDLHELLNDSEARSNLVDNIFSNLREHGFVGVNIDFEGLGVDDREQMIEFMRELRAKLQPDGLLVTQSVPMQDAAYDLSQLAAVNDYLVLMAYDEHEQSGGPGPVASRAWFRQQLETMRTLPPKKLIVGLGNYGYDWRTTGQQGSPVTFSEIMSAARSNRARVAWDEASGNPVLRYQTAREQHEVWFLDAITVLNQAQLVAQAGARGIGLWRLGAEDPAVWSVLRRDGWPAENFDARQLRQLDPHKALRLYGEGEVLRIAGRPRHGARYVWRTEAGNFAERYDRYPSHYVIERSGSSDDAKLIALTFDDGPDASSTPRILDILKGHRVPATFFVVGVNAEAFPGLLKRVYAEGHEIGNHTYSHPNLGEISLPRMTLELNATQRIIQHTLGVSTLLFRPPYAADSEPETPQEIEAIFRAQQLGYLTISERIDPHDWEPGLTSEVIVSEILAEQANGRIVLLHDGGGDRSATVEALPKIITELRAQGYRFVTVSELIGKTRAEVMPPYSGRELGLATLAGPLFDVKGALTWIVGLLFVGSIALMLTRAVLFSALAIYQKRRGRRWRLLAFHPPVSVIIPAHNEVSVIIRTIHSILANGYAEFEVIVVDDGSTDGSAELIQRTFASDQRVRLHRQAKAGKAAALNTAIALAEHSVVVAIDADTTLRQGTIEKLARHFADPRVGAVSGNVRVGNRGTWLTRFQAIEYVCAFNLERRALDVLNAITVVPGAVGAWRKDCIQAVGGFTADTLAEDTDVTLAIRRSGFRIRYEEEAVAYTQVPQDTKALLQQRLRWLFGTLQAAWKNKDAMFRPRYGTLGFVALPCISLFQLGLPLISPAAEIAMLVALVRGNWGIVLAYWCTLFMVELLTALLAYRLEEEPPHDLFWLPGQRIYYRLLLLYVAVKSVLYAVKGTRLEWTKLERPLEVDRLWVGGP